LEEVSDEAPLVIQFRK
jgi:hypothetical protein